MKFNYQARDKDGEEQSGTVEASSEEAALEVLQEHKLYITFLEEQEDISLIFKNIGIFGGISQKDIVMFSRQLSIMIESKILPAQALRTLAKSISKAEFQEKIIRIAEEVESGTPLSKAFALYPKIFSNFYVNMVKSGEVTGKLSSVLNRVADHLEREYQLNMKLKTAMIYPSFILFVFVAIFFVMMIYIFPQLAGVLVEAEVDLPPTTQIMMAISDFMIAWWWAIIVSFIVSSIAIVKYAKTAEGREAIDSFFLKVPLVKNFLKSVYLSRFAENLSTLVVAGIPIAKALDVAAEVIDNSIYGEIILATKENVIKGKSMSSVLEEYPEFVSPLFAQMMKVGEETGTMDTTLMKIVDFYKGEIDAFMDGLLSIIEPILIVALGGGVGILVVSVYIPLYQIGGM
ncbi:type II secretion system F family protein [Candidatus Parcubacteria bacterium]|nr:type II secretion system F family protein [Candidatus Parcubacteria bacterium]